MKVNVRLLTNHVNKATIGGLNKEVALGKHLSFAMADKTGSVISICSNGVSDDEGVAIGITKPRRFIEMIKYAQEQFFFDAPEIELNRVDNHLMFKNEMDEFNILLSDPGAISTTIATPEKVIETSRVGSAAVVVLNNRTRAQCLGAIKVNPDVECAFVVDSGEARLVVGNENEHMADIGLGFVGGAAKYMVQVNPDFLCKVLAAVRGDKAVAIEIRERLPLIFSVPNYTLLLKGI